MTPLHAALTRLPGLAALSADALEPMPLKGVAHDHVRLRGHGLVARVPRWSQMGLDPLAALDHQATAFRRAEPSGHTPRLVALLPPGEGLPMGALLVTEILGRTPRLPADMPAIARALAALHRLPVPADPAPPARPRRPGRGVAGAGRTPGRVVRRRRALPGRPPPDRRGAGRRPCGPTRRPASRHAGRGGHAPPEIS
ncbi:hypothetical protein ACIU1J_20015 [Azospirillum doebereinerae]|uniref:hypothetical protein n=1 Tax=Azospirillum doebereinerae TaxID=92933 RepID=UPI0038503B48